ncbi:MAG: adenine nucleotide alpha hydrolase [Gammaproteobacteria bacterium]|nr:adenine nucleotide alpha hydrolase [Gammaproteobacteria bacterium]
MTRAAHHTNASCPELTALGGALAALGPVAVAVSGGIDSMTLAFVAHRLAGGTTRMLHAVSPAVPSDGSERVREYAAREGWRLTIIDAGEFADARYMANPANRCYFCKTNLYATMAAHTDARIVSGTNLDDLSDFRPGLGAADEHHVRHPYVDAGIDKRGVRRIAAALGLDDLAELPAAPCLSSRIETGIAIDARVLGAVYRSERAIASALSPRTVRCRVRRARVVIELDAQTMDALSEAARSELGERVARTFGEVGITHPVEFEHYRMGGAFLRGGADG